MCVAPRVTWQLVRSIPRPIATAEPRRALPPALRASTTNTLSAGTASLSTADATPAGDESPAARAIPAQIRPRIRRKFLVCIPEPLSDGVYGVCRRLFRTTTGGLGPHPRGMTQVIE